MRSRHAPNRNPAETSFAAVDGRLTKIQREELLNIAQYYDISSYYTNPDGLVTMIHADGSCLGYIDRNGLFTPEF